MNGSVPLDGDWPRTPDGFDDAAVEAVGEVRDAGEADAERALDVGGELDGRRSRCCIRLPNRLMQELFDQVPAGTPVVIRP